MRFGSWIARSLHERLTSSTSSWVAQCDAAHMSSSSSSSTVPSTTATTTVSTGSQTAHTTEVKPKKAKKYSVEWNDNWDFCADQGTFTTDKAGGGGGTKAVRQIILIRHGQYHQGPGGDEKHILTPLGHQQAKETGHRLAALLQKQKIYPIKRIYYSTQVRATETWQEIRSVLPSTMLPSEHHIRPCSMIREGAVCKPVPASTNWKVKEIDFIRDQARVEAAFLRYMHRASSEETDNHSTVFVCHGNVIRYFVMRALQLPPEAWLRTAVYNASITILEIYPNGRVSLRNFGDVGHFDPDHITYN